MKIIGITIYPLRIPFVEAFTHSVKSRHFSDSVIVCLHGDDGNVGYGEGIARSYVTGETPETLIGHILYKLWPVVSATNYPRLISSSDNPLNYLSHISSTITGIDPPDGVVAANGAVAAVETALIDLLLKSQKLSLGALLPPKRVSLTYSGVIASGSTEKALQHVKQFLSFGLKQLKLKVGDDGDVERVGAIRQFVGPDVSLRLDANGAYDTWTAIERIARMEEYDIDCIEQPILRGDASEMAYLSHRVHIPVMVDESLITMADATALSELNACDYFNLRVAKCGGITNTLDMAKLASRKGIKLQLGAQVGETAILSAVGRHIGAYLSDVEFIEGSYGKLLLTEDIGREDINFGNGGKAPILKGAGIGVSVRDDLLAKYAITVIRSGVTG